MAHSLHCSARKLLRISLAELADMARDFSSELDPSSAEVSDLPSTGFKTQAHTFKLWFSSLRSQCEIFWSWFTFIIGALLPLFFPLRALALEKLGADLWFSGYNSMALHELLTDVTDKTIPYITASDKIKKEKSFFPWGLSTLGWWYEIQNPKSFTKNAVSIPPAPGTAAGRNSILSTAAAYDKYVTATLNL